MLPRTHLLLLPLLSPLLLVSPIVVQGQQGDRFDEVRVLILIQQLMEEHRLPSVAVAVAKDGDIVWEEGFGWADLDRQIPATGNVMYSLASISKPMTATALMRLVEQGRVELDRPANEYLGDEKIHSRRWDPNEATVRRVLSHTAGLPHHWEFFYENEDYPARTTDQGIARYGVLVSPPGEFYQYSNLGYGILDRIIERVAHRSYADFMRTELFEPLGLRRTAVSTGTDLGDAAAVRYDSNNRPIAYYDFDHRGASAVYGSVNDLVHFGMFHLSNHLRGQKRILHDSTIVAMQQVATPGSPDQGYGFGWSVLNDDNGYRRISHTGGMPGVSTALYLYPEENLAVAVVANKIAVPVSRIAQEIAVVELPRDPSVSRESQGLPSASSSGENAFYPPPELLGEWSGTVFSPDETIPLKLNFLPDGDVQVQLGEELRTLLNDVSFRDGQLLGRFAGTIPAEDARRHAHSVLVGLRLIDEELVGSAIAQTTGSPLYFSLTSYVELERMPIAP